MERLWSCLTALFILACGSQLFGQTGTFGQRHERPFKFEEIKETADLVRARTGMGADFGGSELAGLILRDIRRRGVDFRLDAEREASLRNSLADERFIATIRDNYREPPFRLEQVVNSIKAAIRELQETGVREDESMILSKIREDMIRRGVDFHWTASVVEAIKAAGVRGDLDQLYFIYMSTPGRQFCDPPFRLETPQPGSVRKNNAGMEFVWIPPGSFQMGSNDDRAGGLVGPAHQVSIRCGFWMSKYEVTQAQYDAITGSQGRNQDCPTCAAGWVNWNDAKGLAERLNTLPDDLDYDLPTEAEWDYAARAGAFGDEIPDLNEVAWLSPGVGGRIHPVGQKKPNAWGLYDMYGNVWEWTADVFARYSNVPDDGSANLTFDGRAAYYEAMVARGSSAREPGARRYERYSESPNSATEFNGFRLIARQRIDWGRDTDSWIWPQTVNLGNITNRAERRLAVSEPLLVNAGLREIKVATVLDPAGKVLSVKASAGTAEQRAYLEEMVSKVRFTPYVVNGSTFALGVSGEVIFYFAGSLEGFAVSTAKPEFPNEATNAGNRVVIDVAVAVDENGRPVSAKAFSGSPEFQRAATAAALKYRFKPFKGFRGDGTAVPVSGTLKISFSR